ncbi:MAG: CYTH domain-containing protein [Chloroflexales bacterium]
MEIEFKFRVADHRIFTQLLSLSTLGSAILIPHAAPEQQHTIYFDTPDEAFRARRASLRVRAVAGRRIATVKRSHGAVDGLHVRDEWETPIHAGVHPRHWPPSEARKRAMVIVGQKPLVARVSVSTRRHCIDVSVEGRPVAELCLDEGHIEAGGRIVGFRELEVELRDAGTLADLDGLCAALTRRFSLEPEPRGKRARGIALLDAILTRPRTQLDVAEIVLDVGCA